MGFYEGSPNVPREGMVVMLKSGGPPMTITRVSGNPEIVECKWFDPSTRELSTALFDVRALSLRPDCDAKHITRSEKPHGQEVQGQDAPEVDAQGQARQG